MFKVFSTFSGGKVSVYLLVKIKEKIIIFSKLGTAMLDCPGRLN